VAVSEPFLEKEFVLVGERPFERIKCRLNTSIDILQFSVGAVRVA
jgi:hypothetical protein